MAIKTLHLTNAYHPSSGGIRTFYRALLAQANQEQRLMRLVVPGAEDAIEEVGRFGRIYTVSARVSPAFDRRYRIMFPDAYLPAMSSHLGRILEREQPDLVEICDKYSLFYLAAMLRKGWMATVKRPTLVGLSCERMDDNVLAYLTRAGAGRAFARAYLRHLYGPPFDYHVANSGYTAAELRQSLWDRAADFVNVCPMGVDFHAFGPAHRDPLLRRRLLAAAGGGPDSVLLLYAGRMSPEKNLSLLIDMLEHLQRLPSDSALDYRLVLAGDGPQAHAIARDAERRVPGRVRSVGAIQDRATLARYYASADAFVHPNPREPFGIGPLEAMASGVPVIAPAAGGVLTYATVANAWLADPDGESFALAVRAAVGLRDHQKLAAARETARQLDWSVVASAYFQLYDELHRRRLAPAPQAPAHPVLWSAGDPLPDFALSTTVSHTNVTGLGHSTFEESEVIK